MDPARLADLIVALHLGYVLFVLVGFALVWIGVLLRWDWVRRPGFRIAHLVCTLIVPLEALAGVVCPLTEWEQELRRRAGQQTEDISFVGRLARDLLFYQAPEWVFTVCYVAFGLVALATFFLVPIRRARRA
jgi:hypothetical protein